METVTLPATQLQSLLIEAARLGAIQGIESALAKTQTHPPKSLKNRIKLKDAAETLGVSPAWLRRRLVKSADPKHAHFYDPNAPTPHKMSPCETAPYYVYENEIIEWYNQLGSVA